MGAGNHHFSIISEWMRKAQARHTAGVFVQDILELGIIRVREIIPRDVFFEPGRSPSPAVNKDGRGQRKVTDSRDVKIGQTKKRPLVVAVTYRVGQLSVV